MLIHHSIWPLFTSINLLGNAITLLNGGPFLYSLMATMACIGGWYNDFLRESQGGNYYNVIWKCVMIGFVLFLVSEAFYFVGLFWCLLSNMLSPTLTSWPPSFISTHFSVMPIIGTLLLIGSSFTATSAHHLFNLGYRKSCMLLLWLTILMGVSFIAVESLEFYLNAFTIRDGIYGSILYMLLGTHLSHVILGLIALLVVTICAYLRSLEKHSTLMDCVVYYWHFVDLVWLVVVAVIYM